MSLKSRSQYKLETSSTRSLNHLGDAVGRLAVTGANGFIGSALVPALRERNVDVVSLVRCDGGVGDRELSVGDIGPLTNWSEALCGVDTVIHTAALAHGRGLSYAELLEVNVEGTLCLARQMVGCGARRLVYLSSIGVLGAETTGVAFTETDPLSPHNPYARSKAEAEIALREVARATGLEVVIVRPPLVHGPGAPGNFGRLLRWMERGLPMPLGAVQGNRRSLVGIENLVDFLAVSAAHPDAAGQTFHVADAESVSTADLLHRLGNLLGSPARLWPVPPRLLTWSAQVFGKREMATQLTHSLEVDISKAARFLGWEPPLSIDEGLRHAVAPFKDA
ncbi:NAD-dependent epimerase/dehydratase family protein [Guyparkeria sp. SB14A]|uniref:NAD-dependent epimerase/dehydratase family protein n=1 Tax=Guyparkeria sp. SB14A TaxID=2571147 RepID=UPI0010AD2081|nr:NAD-dependent epimerase/dehydratase family protein [Guyparkeria sp. SB14A]TKA89444.1 NAD-dependent epimerase/dehydratase family protein [Guyparkeria sp. SB14A]